MKGRQIFWEAKVFCLLLFMRKAQQEFGKLNLPFSDAEEELK